MTRLAVVAAHVSLSLSFMAASASAAPPATPPAKPVAPDAALEALEKAEPFTAPADVLRRAAPDAPEHVSAELLVDDVAISYDAERRITRHEHRIWRVLSAEGVDQLGTLSFPWEPWHQARPVVRARVVTADGRELQLDPKTVSDAAGRVHGQVIDDRKELVVPLPGVGRGSTLEVDVEVRSERAVFDAPAASSRYYFWTDFPVRWLRLRVSAPGTGLHWTAKNFEARGLKVVESQPSGRKLLEVVTHLGTDDQPTTVAEIPWLAWSTGGTWQGMARSYHGAVTQALASPPPDGALPAPKGSPREQADAILTALRARVRYTGLELGQSAVVPYTPAEVWQREYGDCKDMAVLMVHGLSRAGIDARVALLSAGFADDVPSDMVGLDGFDHAIVYVPAQRGADAFWIDPTATDYPAGALPAGDLERRALVIDPATSGLVSTATRDVWPARFRAETTIQLAQLGGAEVDDTLRYEAAYASQVRSSMVGKPQQDLKFTRRWLEDLHGTKSFDDLSVEGAPDAVIVRAKGHEALRYVTGLSSADIDLPRSHIFGSIPSELVDDDRKPLPYRFDQALQLASRARIVAPLGFVLAAGAGSETIQLGPARWTQTIAAAPGEVGVATAEVTLDFGKLDYTSDDVTAFRKAFDALTGNVHKIVFRHAAGSLVAEGDVKGGLARFAEHLAAHPDDAGTRARLALALCDLGVTPAARTEAEKAVKLDPKSRLAAFSQAFIASGDPLCRSMVQGWDRAAAVKAYERLSERFPTWTRARLKLAQILERGARARLDSSGPDVDRAIDVYRKLVKDESVEDAKEPYLKALWRAGRVKDLVADGPSLAQSVATGALWLAAVSIDQSPAAALRQVSQLKGDASAYLSAAIASLMLTRHYPEAAGLAAATLERMPESAYARTIAELAPRVHVVVGSDDFSTPEKALRSVYVRLAGVGPNDDPVPALISAIHPDHARGDDVGSGAAAAADDTSGMGTAAAGIDMLLSIGTVTSVGDDQTGYRVRLEASLGGSPMRIDTFWAKAPAGLRLVSFQDAAELGERARILATKNELAAARVWLDWARELASADRSRVQPTELWPITGREATRDDLVSAAIWFALGGSTPSPETVKLAPGVIAHWPKEQRAVAVFGLMRHVAPAALASLIAGFSDKTPDEERLELSELARAGHAAEALVRVDARLAADPQSHEWLTVAAQAEAARGDLEAAARRFATAVAAGDDHVMNEYAWNEAVRGVASEATERNAKRAVELAEKTRGVGHASATLNTLAYVQLEIGHLKDAADTMRRAIADGAHLRPEDYLLLGRMAEALGYPAIARTSYKQIARDARADVDDGPTGVWAIAQARLAKLPR